MQRIINKGILSNDYEITVYLNEYQKELVLNVLKAAKAFYEGSIEELVEFVKNGFTVDVAYVKGYESSIKELNKTIIKSVIDNSLISLLNKAISTIEDVNQKRYRIGKEVFDTVTGKEAFHCMGIWVFTILLSKTTYVFYIFCLKTICMKPMPMVFMMRYAR